MILNALQQIPATPHCSYNFHYLYGTNEIASNPQKIPRQIPYKSWNKTLINPHNFLSIPYKIFHVAEESLSTWTWVKLFLRNVQSIKCELQSFVQELSQLQSQMLSRASHIRLKPSATRRRFWSMWMWCARCSCRIWPELCSRIGAVHLGTSTNIGNKI